MNLHKKSLYNVSNDTHSIYVAMRTIYTTLCEHNFYLCSSVNKILRFFTIYSNKMLNDRILNISMLTI